MADNNRNQDRQSYNQDWEQHRHRFNEGSEHNQQHENYGSQNTNYGQGRGQSGNYGQGSGYAGGSGQRGDMGQGGYGGSSYGMGNQGGYGNQQRYGNTGSSNYGQGSSGGHDESSFGGGYGHRSDWDRNQWQGSGSQGNYGSEDWRRHSGSGQQGGYSGSNYGSGSHGSGNYGSGNYGSGNYGSSNYGSNYGRRDYNQNRERNIYGGDERNYGNANQGGFDRDWWQRTKDEVSSWFGDEDAERRRRMDRTTDVSHRGKGPKDYKRSEDRIREDVCDRLADDDRIDATHINVQVQGTEVILTGTVNSREEKRRAEDLIESISGVRDVENRLKVGKYNEDSDRAKWPRSDADDDSRKSL